MFLIESMTSFLLTEIALDLLGNKFYTVNGEHVRDLQALYKLTPDEQPTGEPTLSSFLCISETSLKAADNLESPVIVLDDDEGDDKDSAEVSPNAINLEDDPDCQEIEIDSVGVSEEDFPLPLLHTTDSTQEIDIEDTSTLQSNGSFENAKGFSFSQSASKNRSCAAPLLYKTERDFKSEDINERLAFIMEASVEEYARMKQHSTNLKNNFIETNQALINLRSLKEQDFLKRFYMQQKISLIEESNSLMQFIKIVKNGEMHSKSILSRVAGDILKAKDMIA